MAVFHAGVSAGPWSARDMSKRHAALWEALLQRGALLRAGTLRWSMRGESTRLRGLDTPLRRVGDRERAVRPREGSFTGADSWRKGVFEEAHGGTLFLDEVGELPLELQAKLPRVLESGEVKPVGASRPFHVDVRVVAATHRELRAWARQGKFREDLYYRLGVMPLVVLPLHSRRSGIRGWPSTSCGCTRHGGRR